MTNADIFRPASTARMAVHVIYPLLVSFPIVCFVGALVTDIAYWRTAEMMWADFSAWLLFAGLVVGALAAIAGLIDVIANRGIRPMAAAWFHMTGNAVVLLLALFNSFVHSRDAWTSVVPTGLLLSVLTVVVMLVTGWIGWALVDRRRVGVAE